MATVETGNGARENKSKEQQNEETRETPRRGAHTKAEDTHDTHERNPEVRPMSALGSAVQRCVRVCVTPAPCARASRALPTSQPCLLDPEMSPRHFATAPHKPPSYLALDFWNHPKGREPPALRILHFHHPHEPPFLHVSRAFQSDLRFMSISSV